MVQSSAFALVLSLVLSPGAIAAVPVESPGPAQLEAEVMTPDHVAKLASIGSAAISPDGTHVAYTRSVPRIPLEDEDGSAYSELYVMNLADGVERPYITGEVSVRSIGWMLNGSSTTQSVVRSRSGSEQMEHGSIAVIELHCEQWKSFSLTSTMDSASSRASSAEILRRWCARRVAVLGPMPGSRDSSPTSRASGSLVGTKI